MGVVRTAAEAYVSGHGVLETLAHRGYRGTHRGVPLPRDIILEQSTAASCRGARPCARAGPFEVLEHRRQEACGLAAGGGPVVEGQGEGEDAMHGWLAIDRDHGRPDLPAPRMATVGGMTIGLA